MTKDSLSEFKSDHLNATNQDGILVVVLHTASIYEEEIIEQIGRDLNSLLTTTEINRMVVDIKAVCLITSSLIGKFVHLHRKLKKENGCLVLCGVQGHLETIFRASNLLKYFNIVSNQEKAIKLARDFVPEKSE